MDLLFTTLVDSRVEYIHEVIVPVDKHHPPDRVKFNIAINATHTHYSRTGRRGFNFTDCDYSHINSLLADVNWNATLSSEDLDNNVDKFYEVLNEVISTNVPISGTSKNYFPPWYNSEMKNLVRDKKMAHRSLKSRNLLDDFIKFKERHTNCIRRSRSLYQSFVSRAEASINRNARSFWTFVNKLKSTNAILTNIVHADNVATDAAGVADLFSIPNPYD